MASKEIPLLEGVCTEIQIYLDKFENHKGKIILVFPTTNTAFTGKCIEMVAAMANLFHFNINNHAIVGRAQDFSRMLLQTNLNKSSGGTMLVKTPEKARKQLGLPLLFAEKMRHRSAPLINLVNEMLNSPTTSNVDNSEAIKEGSLSSASMQESDIDYSKFVRQLQLSENIEHSITFEVTDVEQNISMVSNDNKSVGTLEPKIGFKFNPDNDNIVLKLKDGSKHVFKKVDCSDTESQTLTTSHGEMEETSAMHSGSNMENMSQFGHLQFIENVFLYDKDLGLDFAAWKNNDGVEEFQTEIVKYFGRHVTLVLVPSRFTNIEKNPVYNLTHVMEAYEIPPEVCVENAINLKCYIRWWNSYSNALMLTRSSADAERVLKEAKTFKARPMKYSSPMALLTAYALIPDLCKGFGKPSDS